MKTKNDTNEEPELAMSVFFGAYTCTKCGGLYFFNKDDGLCILCRHFPLWRYHPLVTTGNFVATIIVGFILLIITIGLLLM